MDIDKIKSLYAEFKGYLNETPSIKVKQAIHIKQIWEHYNNSVRSLSEISGRDYSNFLIIVEQDENGNDFIFTQSYRSKLSGLISKLGAEYSIDIPVGDKSTGNDYKSVMPSIVISQTQQQSQQILFQMILDVQSKIDEKMPSLQEGSKEKTFFQKLKGSLSATTGIIDLLGKIFIMAKECGVPTDQLQKLFS